jgi:hypothetical protein
MKKKEIKNEENEMYVAPRTECIEVKMECGFATSTCIKKDDTNIDNWNLNTNTWDSTISGS